MFAFLRITKASDPKPNFRRTVNLDRQARLPLLGITPRFSA
jgi:hypothetical protein